MHGVNAMKIATLAQLNIAKLINLYPGQKFPVFFDFLSLLAMIQYGNVARKKIKALSQTHESPIIMQ